MMQNSQHDPLMQSSSEEYTMKALSAGSGRDSSSSSSSLRDTLKQSSLEEYTTTALSAGRGRDSSSGSSLRAFGAIPPAYSYCSYDHFSNNLMSGECSPCNMSPWHHSIPLGLTADGSCADNSGWSMSSIPEGIGTGASTCLIGSLVREEGHIYSLAASGPLLYTGSDSKNIRVWKNQKEYAAFKSSSGLVKAIIITGGGRILTGHQDGKIRVWRISLKDPTSYRRVGSLPRLKDLIKYSLKPSNFAELRRQRIRHSDTVSCLSFAAEQGLLYSGSWDRTFKIWRLADSKCLESVLSHDDAVNSVVAARFDDLVFTGSADGTVKVWRREMQGKGSKHKPMQTLLKQESAVTALIIGTDLEPVVYSSSSDGLINFWEWERERKVFNHGGVLRGHKLAVLCLASAGRLMLSGSADKTICVWRREGMRMHSCLFVLIGHSGPVKCLAIEEEEGEEKDHIVDRRPSMFKLYSGSLDKSVKVWRISELSPDARLRGPNHFAIDSSN